MDDRHVITISAEDLDAEYRRERAREFRAMNPFTPLPDQDIDCVSAMNAVIARARRDEARERGLAWAVEDIDNTYGAAMAATR